VRPVALVVLIVGMGLSLRAGAWAVATGLAVIGTLTLGLLVRYLDRQLMGHPERVSSVTSTGTTITMSVVSILPTLVVGIVCVLVIQKYWWMGFPAGLFLGFAVSLVALYGAIAFGLRRVVGTSQSPA
jgi:uncharacterized membrane protein